MADMGTDSSREIPAASQLAMYSSENALNAEACPAVQSARPDFLIVSAFRAASPAARSSCVKCSTAAICLFHRSTPGPVIMPDLAAALPTSPRLAPDAAAPA